MFEESAISDTVVEFTATSKTALSKKNVIFGALLITIFLWSLMVSTTGNGLPCPYTSSVIAFTRLLIDSIAWCSIYGRDFVAVLSHFPQVQRSRRYRRTPSTFLLISSVPTLIRCPYPCRIYHHNKELWRAAASAVSLRQRESRVLR